MTVDVIMPNLGLTMEEGTVTRWLLTSGERVEQGQPLFEVETDKVSVEVEALAAGVLGRILVEAGQKAAVGTVLARIHDPESQDDKAQEQGGERHPPIDQTPPKTSGEGLFAVGSRQRDLAARPAQSGAARLFSSPRARKRARELGIDWRSLAGSGPRGRVIERDVLSRTAHVQQRGATDFESAPHLPMTYLTAEVDLSALLDAQRRLAPAIENLTLSDWLARMVGAALTEIGMDASIAIVADRGGAASVIRETAYKSLAQIVAERTRSARASTAFSGPTFAIHDLSASRIGSLLASPTTTEIARLSLGRVRDNGYATITLSSSNTALEARQAIYLLETVISLIEEPFALLL